MFPSFFSLFFTLCVFSLVEWHSYKGRDGLNSLRGRRAAQAAEAEAAVAAFTLLSSSFSRL